MRLTLAEIAEAVKGEISLTSNPETLNGVSTDSRTLEPGQLFVPLMAEHDGHDFINAAVEAGAVACLSARNLADASPVPIVVVPDTAIALTDLARVARSRLEARVVGITGSVGKTTTKDFCSATIGAALRCWVSEKSFNNEIGLPLTILNAPDNCEVLVTEMGASAPGDIANLCETARPHYGILTSIAIAHTESFGTIDQIARTKAELLEALPVDGVAVVNRDDELVMAQAERVLSSHQTSNSLLTFGLHTEADVRAEDVSVDGQLHAQYLLRSPWGSERVRLDVAGRHNVGNSLAAATVALHLGVSVEAVVEGLSEAKISPWRMSLDTSPSGVLVLNDSYNANPTSMEAALQALTQLSARQHYAVLGTMAELGDYHDSEHLRIADFAKELGVKVISVAEPAYGLEALPDITSALQSLSDLGEGSAVLIKGSRVAGLEHLADRLLEL